ncbi:hypothetical protein OCU04_006866 [Sclerotinia nivalis]|uniref:Uncharacterized protein n=1 Tax=Sclerotinia nivalis TaxID=352851 RepID=A0A9X0AKN8_9HELO|nr:hypothetical protein OCU04_006866 [Sclerotinia nivalis]
MIRGLGMAELVSLSARNNDENRAEQNSIVESRGVTRCNDWREYMYISRRSIVLTVLRRRAVIITYTWLSFKVQNTQINYNSKENFRIISARFSNNCHHDLSFFNVGFGLDLCITLPTIINEMFRPRTLAT